jgi:tRNA 2-thiouridine synthesizing protein E
MTSQLVAGQRVLALDADGYLRNLDAWSEEVADALAQQSGLQLTAGHWEILHLLRDFYRTRGVTPVMRILVKLVERELGPAKGNSLYLLGLFPESPARVAARIAGLPRPVNCL